VVDRVLYQLLPKTQVLRSPHTQDHRTRTSFSPNNLDPRRLARQWSSDRRMAGYSLLSLSKLVWREEWLDD
jgi:hypothetical protein